MIRRAVQLLFLASGAAAIAWLNLSAPMNNALHPGVRLTISLFIAGALCLIYSAVAPFFKANPREASGAAAKSGDPSKKADGPKRLGRPAEGGISMAGLAEKGALIAAGLLSLLLLANGVAQNLALEDAQKYMLALNVHRTVGYAATAALAVYVLLSSIRLFSFKITLLTFLYAASFWWTLIIPASFPLVFTVFVGVLFPLFILRKALHYAPPLRRVEIAVKGVGLYGFTFVLLTGLFSTFLPIEYRYARYSSYLRLFHVVTALWMFLPLAGHFLIQWERRRGRPQGAMKIAGIAALMIVSLAAGLHGQKIKSARLATVSRENVFPTRLFAEKEGEKFRSSAAEPMMPSSECGQCHEVIYRQWSRSVHAWADRVVSFQKVAGALMEKHGTDTGKLCAHCHDPNVALLDKPELLIDPDYMRTSEGVGCGACHYISAVEEKNAWYALTIPRGDFFSNKPGGRGGFILNAIVEHVKDNARPPARNGSMCFSCHHLESKRGGHIKTPLDNVTSYLESDIGKRAPCHRCHMPRTDLDRHGYTWMDHSFYGSQFDLPKVAIMSAPGDAALLQDFTEKSQLWMDGKLPVRWAQQAAHDEKRKTLWPGDFGRIAKENRLAVEVASGGPHFAMALEHAKTLDGRLELKLSTLNVNVSHDYPSNLFANITEVWLELEVTDAAGKRVHFSGWDPDDWTHRLGRIEVDADGRAIRPEESLSYVDIVNIKYLEPEKKYFESYTIPLPDGVQFPLAAAYRIMYRRYDDQTVEWMTNGRLKAVPVRTIHEQTFSIPG